MTTFAAFFPQVSAIIPIYNGASELPDLLACLHNQAYPKERVEYLLVDNASRDRTPELLQKALVTAAQRGLNLRVLSENQIQSSYAARNRGIRAATGEILAFTDTDCRPQTDWLYEIVQPFARQQVGLVAGEVASLPGKTLLEWYAEQQQFLTQKNTLAHPFYPYGQTANLAVRRQVFEQVGLFRPYLTTGGDADLCWRTQQETAWTLEFAEAAIVRHHHRATFQDLRSQWQRYGRSNRYLHELHGIELMREISRREVGYRLLRWLVKELPVNGVKTLVRRGKPVDLIHTPLQLFCARNRYLGQANAQLSEAARQIEWLNQSQEAIPLG